MEKSTIKIIKLTAADGMVLTNGDAYGREVFLGKGDDAANWREITEAEMVKFYVLQIKLGKITLEDVPTRWRDAVAAMLADAEGVSE